MRTSLAILNKQFKDSLNNLPTLMIIMIYPIVAFIMIIAMRGEEFAGRMFISMFATMHCCFAPATTASNIISEEKEKGTLRSLIMSGVSRINYLVSISLFVILASMLTGSTFLLMDQFDCEYAFKFLSAMFLGAVTSTLLGLCIGINSKNTAAANGMAVPVGLTISLIPMLAQFNDGIAKVSKLLYSGRISLILGDGGNVSWDTAAVIGAYLVLFSVILVFLFKKKGLEQG